MLVHIIIIELDVIELASFEIDGAAQFGGRLGIPMVDQQLAIDPQCTPPSVVVEKVYVSVNWA